jgi:Phospholipase_D-nuclease N-terminal
MPVFAVSEFLHSLFIILVATPFILLWGAAVLDVIRRHYTGWTVVGWLLLILALPIVGPLIYFATRKPGPEAAERMYMAGADLARERAARPAGGVGMGPMA